MMSSTTHYKYYFPAFLWFVFILFATLSSTSTLEVLNWKNFFSYDKPIHMLLFGTQAYLVIRGADKNALTINSKLNLVVCLLTALFGASIEYLQILLTSSRSFDYFDMLANAIGALIAYFVIKRKFIKKAA